MTDHLQASWLMQTGQFALQVAEVLSEGLRSNLWGLGCLVNCQAPDLPLLALTFVLGAAAGSLATLLLAFRPPTPRVLERPVHLPSAAQRRLWRCMGSEEDVTHLCLNLEGLQISITTKRRPPPTLPLDLPPVQRARLHPPSLVLSPCLHPILLTRPPIACKPDLVPCLRVVIFCCHPCP